MMGNENLGFLPWVHMGWPSLSQLHFVKNEDRWFNAFNKDTSSQGQRKPFCLSREDLVFWHHSKHITSRWSAISTVIALLIFAPPCPVYSAWGDGSLIKSRMDLWCQACQGLYLEPTRSRFYTIYKPRPKTSLPHVDNCKRHSKGRTLTVFSGSFTRLNLDWIDHKHKWDQGFWSEWFWYPKKVSALSLGFPLPQTLTHLNLQICWL